ncbi:MAG: TIGR04255 family protein [Planctomycetes bacterium]|nr:TIGR04255 family protein [Planctomycetota bacterium]
MAHSYDPLTAPPPAEVALSRSPLERVLAQVRFAPVLSVNRPDFVGPFQEAIRSDYPHLQPETSQTWNFGSEGVASTSTAVAWRFLNSDQKWIVVLTHSFVTLETTSYVTRSDFMARFAAILEALYRLIGPTSVDRLGVRYSDRITETTAEQLGGLLRPEVFGTTPLLHGGRSGHCITESLYEVPEGFLLARWGWMPPQVTVDAAVFPVIDRHSWILDLDVSTAAPMEFEPALLVERARSMAARSYTMFRWCVEDEFLRHFGGSI